MKALILSSLLLATFVMCAQAQLSQLPRRIGQFVYIGRGSCPSVNVAADFDKDRYLGLWYEIARFPVIYEYKSNCVTAEYSELENRPETIKVTNTGIKENGELSVAVGRAKTPDADEPSKLTVSFGPEILAALPGFLSRIGFSLPEDDGNYWILDTDYDNYALVHSCNQRRGFHTMANWILSRTPVLDEAVKDAALDVFSGYGIPIEKFLFTEQSDCWRDEVPE
ncbi:apolipoprotein D-like [Amphiura filiformis]|uniref:apolipoprotein D-like n=1 Tax=Amphiura filiformis TaxID=82378 RepID=UPI003B212507